jgi:hypothetical protein
MASGNVVLKVGKPLQNRDYKIINSCFVFLSAFVVVNSDSRKLSAAALPVETSLAETAQSEMPKSEDDA